MIIYSCLIRWDGVEDSLEGHHIHRGTEIDGGTWSIEEVNITSKDFQEVEVFESKDSEFEEHPIGSTLGRHYSDVVDRLHRAEIDAARGDFSNAESVIEYYENFGLDYDETNFGVRELLAVEIVTRYIIEGSNMDPDFLESQRQREDSVSLQHFLGRKNEHGFRIKAAVDCNIDGLWAAWLFEKMYNENLIEATGVLNQNYHKEHKGHVWAELVNEEGERLISDPGMIFAGVPTAEDNFYEVNMFEYSEADAVTVDMDNDYVEDLNVWNYGPEIEIHPNKFNLA